MTIETMVAGVGFIIAGAIGISYVDEVKGKVASIVGILIGILFVIYSFV